MKKKLLSLFMACAMILALAVPAFAATYNVNPEDGASEDLTQTVTIATRTFIPTVALTLPTMTEPSVVLNPYKITFAGEEAVVNGQEVKDDSSTQNPDQEKQVISPVYFIKNQTNVKLNYTVAVTGSLEGDVIFSQEPVSLTESKKKAHIALMVANKGIVPANNSTDPSQATTAEQKITNVNGLTAADIETQWLKTTEVKFTQPKSLDAASTSAANYVAFQFKGDLTRQATPNAWTADDKIGAVITFTFTPESAHDFAYEGASDATELGFGDVSIASTTAITKVINTTNFDNYNDYKVNATSQDAAKWDFFVKPSTPDIVKLQKTTGTGATTWELVMDPAKVKAAYPTKADGTAHDASGEAHTDTMVLSFVDEDNIPRTLSVPFTFTIKN